jgi:hypothetical protein
LLTGTPCKHIIAARIVRDREGGTPTPTVPAPTPKRKTYPQRWSDYNEAQAVEKFRFRELLADLCRDLPEPAEPAGKRGRKPHPLRDRLFAAAYKVYYRLSRRQNVIRHRNCCRGHAELAREGET